MPLLEIANLTVEFPTLHGAFKAVDEVDLTVDQGEIVAIVGESGSGKSVSMLAVMGLLPWTARVSADRLVFDGRDLARLSRAARRQIRGKDMAMIFQEPMTSLNPCFTVGFQLTEAIRAHEGATRQEARRRAIALLDQVGIPAPESRLRAFPHQLSGGMQPAPPDRRRADHRARRDHPGADPRSPARTPAAARHGADPDHP
jgi:dipeptide transport system ATP-binding protein